MNQRFELRARSSVSPSLRPGGRPRPAGAAVASAARLVCERLEGRTLLSVTTNAQGWTVVTPSPDSRLVYVSSGAGNDANDGLSPATAVATITRGRALVRNGMPDQLLLRRGDTFFAQGIANWNLSGRAADEPIVVGAYTDPALPSSQRPKLATGTASGFTFTTTVPVSHVYVTGIAFEAHTRNYRSPPNNGEGFSTAIRSDALGSTYGLRTFGATDDLLVEDCSFQYYRTNITMQSSTDAAGATRAVSNVRIRRNQILDAYAPNVDEFGITTSLTSEGIYADAVQGLTIDGNVLSHNGWAENNALGAVASIYNHNVYLNINNTGVVFTNNVVADAASHGLQARAGGIVRDNLFLRNPIAMSYGYVNGPVRPGGVSGEISGNVVVGSGRIVDAGRGWGLEISNLRPAAGGGGTVVRNNVYAANLATDTQAAIKLDVGSVDNPTQDAGINDLRLENNVVYAWARGLYVHPGFNNPADARFRPMTGLTVRGNDFQRLFSGAGPMVEHNAPFVAAAEAWANNRYDGTRADGGSTRWFKVGTALTTFDQWAAAYEPTAARALGLFPDPGRSAGGYNATLGGENSTDAFLDQARRQSRTYWRPKYAAGPVLEYVRAGYAGGRVDAAAPTASADADNVTVAGAATYTFSVTYADDNKLDLTSLGAGDVRVVGPDGFSAAAALVSSAGTAGGDRRTATYAVAAPGGKWSPAANGLYAVVVQAGEVRDVTGKAAAADPVGQFAVTIDPAAPEAVATAPAVGLDAAPAVVTVTYTGADVPALPTAAPPLNAGFETPNVGANSFFAFQYNPADGGWTFAGHAGVAGNAGGFTVANPPAPQGGQVAFVQDAGSIAQTVAGWQAGTYTVAFQAAQRGFGNAAAQDLQVLVDGAVVGTVTPAGPEYAAYATAPFTVAAGAHEVRIVGLNSAGGDNTALVDDVRVVGTTTPYTQLIAAGTLDPADVRLTGPGGINLPAATAAVDQPGVDDRQRTVTYTFPAPAEGWAAATDGPTTLAVNVAAGQVATANGVAVRAAKVGTVRVAVDAPTATVAAGNVSAGSTAALAFTVTYAAAAGGIAPSIDAGDLRVTGPGTFNSPVALVGLTGDGSPDNPVSATYSVDAPAGGWTGAANGTYFVVAQPGQVTDAAGTPLAAGPIGLFRVAVDATPPLAQSNENDITSPTPLGQTAFPKIVTVTYADPGGINLATLDDLDVRVTGPNGYDAALTRSTVYAQTATSVTVDYLLAPPAAGWKAGYNGTYTIALQPGQVADAAGNFNPLARALDTFAVALETTPPVATVGPVTPDPRSSAVGSVTVTFAEVVTGFDVADVSLTYNGSAVSLANSTVASADNKTYVLSGLSGLTGAAGTYALTVTAAGSGVVDLAGNAMAANAVDAWVVDLTAPTAALGSATAVADPTAAGHAITVNYADNVGFNPATFDGADLLVTGPNGYANTATLVSVGAGAGARAVAYAATPPAGGWRSANNGTYTVALQSGQVADAAGNPLPGRVLGTFAVGLETTPPTVAVAAVAPTPRQVPVDAITVTFSERVAGFDAADLSLTRDGAAVPLAGVTVTSADGGTTYAVGGLTAATSVPGAYAFTLTAFGSGIADPAGNPLAAGATTPFTVVPAPAPTGYAAAVLADRPVAYYRLGQTSGTFAADASGNRLDGAYAGAYALGVPGALAGDADPAVGFAGADGQVVVPDAPALRLTGDLTVEAWVYRTAAGADWARVVGKGEADLATRNYGLWIEPGVVDARVLYQETGAQVNLFSGVTVGLNAWHHVAATVAAGAVTLYVDGQAVGAATRGAAPTVTAAPLTVGYSGYHVGVSGRVDEVAVYDRGLAADRVAAHYQAGASGPPPGPTAQLVDAAADVVIGALVDGATIDMGQVGGRLNVLATPLGPAGSIEFRVDGQSVRTESFAPYSIGGDAGTDYFDWTPPVGQHVLQLVQYAGAGGGGGVLWTTTLNLTVLEDRVAPTAAVSAIAPNPRQAPVDSLVVTFSEPVAGLDLADLTLARDGVPVSLAGATLSAARGDRAFTVDGLTAATTPAGTYTLTVAAAGSGVVDARGNALAADAAAAWTNAPAAPTVTGVSPAPVAGSPFFQFLTIAGTDFPVGASVVLRNLTTGAASTPSVLRRSATQVIVVAAVGTAAADWTAEVTGPTGTSAAAPFAVSAQAPITVSVTRSAAGKTASLSVRDAVGANLTFAWSTLNAPAGAPLVTYSVNNSAAAANAVATFGAAGTYVLNVRVSDGATSVDATATVVVAQQLSAVTVAPASATVTNGKTLAFAAAQLDQFGRAMSPALPVAWSRPSGVGSVSSAGVYTAPASGTGATTVRATVGGQSATAAVTVVPAFSTLQVDFVPSSAAVVSGYQRDGGSTYGARGNGYTYGWNVSHTDAVVDRNRASSQLIDTTIGVKAGGKWEIALANGRYTVLVDVGDPSVVTTNTVRVEGTTLFNAVRQSANTHSSRSVTVTVTDGRLTIDAGSAANLATRMAYLKITKA